MANQEQLMTALRNADAAGDTAAAQRFSGMIRSQQAATSAEPEPTFGEQIIGGLETAGTFGSSIAAEPIAGVAGLLSSLVPGGEEGVGAGVVEGVREQLTYEPRTKAGREQLISLSETLQPLAEGLKTAEQTLGDLGYELGELIPIEGAPEALGAAGATIPTAALEALGLVGAKPLAKAKEARKVKQAIEESAPTIEQLQARSRGIYKEVDDSGVTVKPEKFLDLAIKVEDTAKKMGYDPDVTPAVKGVLRRFEEEVGNAHTISDIDTLRKVAQNSAKSINPAEAAIGSALIGKVDEFFENLSPKDMEGTITGSGAGRQLAKARDLWGRGRRSEMMEEAFRSAENQASGFENGLRIKLNSILNSPKKRKGFSKEELGLMKKVVQGTTAANIAKLVGKFGMSEGRVQNLLLPGMGVGAGGALGGGVGAIAVPAIGQVSKVLAQRLTSKNARFADEVVRSGRNASKIARSYIRNTPKKDQKARELTELFITQKVPFDQLDKLKNSKVKAVADAAFFAAAAIKQQQQEAE